MTTYRFKKHQRLLRDASVGTWRSDVAVGATVHPPLLRVPGNHATFSEVSDDQLASCVYQFIDWAGHAEYISPETAMEGLEEVALPIAWRLLTYLLCFTQAYTSRKLDDEEAKTCARQFITGLKEPTRAFVSSTLGHGLTEDGTRTRPDSSGYGFNEILSRHTFETTLVFDSPEQMHVISFWDED